MWANFPPVNGGAVVVATGGVVVVAGTVVVFNKVTVGTALVGTSWETTVVVLSGAPATTIAVTVMNLVARDRIGTTDHPLVAAKVLFRQRKRLFGVLLLFMYMKVRTRLFGVPRPSVCP